MELVSIGVLDSSTSLAACCLAMPCSREEKEMKGEHGLAEAAGVRRYSVRLTRLEDIMYSRAVLPHLSTWRQDPDEPGAG